MAGTLRLWWLLQRRSRTDRSDPAHLTGVLAIIAFAVTTALALVVLGGFLAFLARARDGLTIGLYDGDAWVVAAGIAVALLVVPLATLGGAAARLAMARRDSRLASLRLAGATTSQVTALTLLDAGTQALTGALLGCGGYVALIPAVAQLRFQERTFTFRELWVGPGIMALALAAVMVVAMVSAAASLARVAVTPLGVAARVTPPGLSAARVVGIVVAGIAAAVVSAVTGSFGVVVLVLALCGVLMLGLAVVNLLGPWVLAQVGRLAAARARSVSTLLAGRRVVDDPRTAWRSVGGVALATFVAGVTSILALFEPSAYAGGDAVYLTDLRTGGLLTLAIAGVLAAVSTGVTQAGRIIDQRETYRALILAGTPRGTLENARMKETAIPLGAALGTATLAMLVVMLPILGATVWAQPAVIVQFVLAVGAAAALVLLGALASSVVARRVTASVS